MEPKRKLFDKPMAELREAFVRNRFAQEDVFGAPEIEAWLRKQRDAERPDEDGWNRFLAHDLMARWADRDIFGLRDHATTLGALNAKFGSLGMADEYGAIYDRLAFSNNDYGGLYWGNGVGVYVADRQHGPMFLIRETDRQVTVRRIGDLSRPSDGSRAIVSVIFQEWAVGRPEWRAARNSLCMALEAEIGIARTKAEADFDSAVAVSADGTKIVHADWVVVLGQDGDGKDDLKFPASAFRERKILGTGPCKGCSFKNEVTRITLDGSISATVQGFFMTAASRPGAWEAFQVGYRQITLHTRATPPEQLLVCLSDGRVLLTHRAQCPDPLPEGGMPVV